MKCKQKNEDQDLVREVLVFGNPDSQFHRIGISQKLTYQGEVSVYEMSAEDYSKLESDVDEQAWEDAESGWRYAEGSNLGAVNKRFSINNHYLLAWGEERGDYRNRFDDISQYLEEVVGATTTRNVTACLYCLAKQNKINLSSLLIKYKKVRHLSFR